MEYAGCESSRAKCSGSARAAACSPAADFHRCARMELKTNCHLSEVRPQSKPLRPLGLLAARQPDVERTDRAMPHPDIAPLANRYHQPKRGLSESRSPDC